MRSLLNNPFVNWLKWFLYSRKMLRKYKNKKLKMGYMTRLKNVQIGQYNTFYDSVVVKNSKIGDFVYVAPNTKINNVSIGNFCSIASNVKIGLGMHPTNFVSTFPAFFSTKKQCQITFSKKDYFNEFGTINIGNDVWIGYGAIIVDNVSIGDGAIIAAGAVVSKDVEPYTIVGGVPAKIIKKRFSDNEIAILEKIKWWEKDEVWLRENAHLFNNLAKLIKKIS